MSDWRETNKVQEQETSLPSHREARHRRTILLRGGREAQGDRKGPWARRPHRRRFPGPLQEAR